MKIKFKYYNLLFFLASYLIFTTFALARNVEIGLATLSKDGHMPSSGEIAAFEKKLGKPIQTVNWFLGFNGDTGDLPPFPLKTLQANLPTHIVPMLTWEPWGYTKDEDDNLRCPLNKINNGDLDDYIKSYALAMKKYGKTIRLRFGHEMIQADNPKIPFPNPKWYPWQDYPKEYVKAYQHIYTIFKSQGVKNVQFVWSVNFEPHNFKTVSKYYPGPQYVDWIGIDGYNWSGQNFDGIFKGMYEMIIQNSLIFGHKPIMLSEIAAAKNNPSQPFNKSQWIKDAFNKIEMKYPQIKSFYWFNVQKEKDWRLDETKWSWQAFKEAMKSKIY